MPIKRIEKDGNEEDDPQHLYNIYLIRQYVIIFGNYHIEFVRTCKITSFDYVLFRWDITKIFRLIPLWIDLTDVELL